MNGAHRDLPVLTHLFPNRRFSDLFNRYRGGSSLAGRAGSRVFERGRPMRIDMVPIGDNPPESLNVIIEVPVGGEPVKYEFDKKSGALFVDRILQDRKSTRLNSSH